MIRRLAFALLVLLMLAAPATALADGGEEGRFVLGGNYVLPSGDTLVGDLVIMGGTARTEAESEVTGSIVVMGGAVKVAGIVDKDVTVLGGSVDLLETAVVNGQVIAVGGTIKRAPGAQVYGDVVEGFPDVDIPFDFRIPVVRAPRFNGVFDAVGQVVGAIFGTLAVLALALLAILLLPEQTEQVASVMMDEPVLSAGAGLLTLVVAPILMVLLVVTCIGPVALALALGIAALFGWIAAGLILGRKVLEAVKVKETTALVEVLVGVAIITLVSRVPCVGWLFGLVIAAAGLGAVILSRFGTSAYPWSEGDEEEFYGEIPAAIEDDSGLGAVLARDKLEAGDEPEETDAESTDEE